MSTILTPENTTETNVSSEQQQSGMQGFFNTSLGHYVRNCGICVLLVLIAGISNYLSLTWRSQSFNYIRTQQEPLRESTVFLENHIRELQNNINHYLLSDDHQTSQENRIHRNIHNISDAVNKASTNDPLHQVNNTIASLSPELLALYNLTEIIIYNKQHNYPLATIQLQALNHYCDTTINPHAHALAEQQNQYLATTLKNYSTVSLTSLTATIVALIALIFLSIWIARSSQRTFNKPLLLSIFTLVISTIWFIASSISSSLDIGSINKSIYRQLSHMYSISSALQTIEYQQYQYVLHPTEQAAHANIIEENIATMNKLLPHIEHTPEYVQSAPQLSAHIHAYVDATHAFMEHNNSPYTIVRPVEIEHNFTLPQPLLRTSTQLINIFQSKIVSQMSKAQSRYNYVNPFYYLLSVITIAAIIQAAISRMKEYL